MLNRFRSPDIRYARRMARIARWDRPLTTRLDRLRAWSNMLLADHGLVRVLYLNLHRVTPRVWRSAQPAPNQIAAIAKRHGIRTVITLRGGREFGAWPLQREACDAAGIALAEFTLRSREAPDRDAILALEPFFASLTYPILFHCKSGADRAGFMAALYLLIVEKASAAAALDQLHWRYGHLRFAKTGVLDAFIEAYRDEGETKGIGFLDWVRDQYDPAALKARLKQGFWSTLVVDRILRRE